MDTLSGVAHGDGLRLDAFVPAIVRRRLAWLPAPVLEPAAERFEAALLLTDLSDFTSLAESFAQRGPRGAEDLKDVLNFFCGHIVELIEAHGGEVLKFAGDAALALWRVDGLACADATRAAAQCATAAQRAFEEQAAPHGVRLRLRSGIGFGDVWAATVGGVAGRWELLVSGDPLSQAVHAVSAAAAGEIALGAAAWGQLSPYARGRRVGQANVRLDALTEPLPPRASSAIAACPDEWLRPYVPRSVQTRLDAAHGEWIAEFRRVSSLFIKLDGLVDGASDALDRLQRAVVTVQAAVYRYGGSINQLVVDDKGTVVVCGWGLAFHTYGDDPVRAVRAALEVRSRLQQGALNGSFGLASGTIFTGLLGNRRRCTFAMIGDVVNVAARLMEGGAPPRLAGHQTARSG
jgi:class 3 adenylate cyclase